MKNLQYDAMDKNPDHAQYYRGSINKINKEINDEKTRVDTYSPTLFDLNDIHKQTEATYGQNMVNTYTKKKSGNSTWQSKYLKAKAKWLNDNVVADKNASVKFTMENGIDPKKLITRYQNEALAMT